MFLGLLVTTAVHDFLPRATNCERRLAHFFALAVKGNLVALCHGLEKACLI
jgi:hypothetical protein